MGEGEVGRFLCTHGSAGKHLVAESSQSSWRKDLYLWRRALGPLLSWMVRCWKGVRVNKEKEFETMMLVTERYSWFRQESTKCQSTGEPGGGTVSLKWHAELISSGLLVSVRTELRSRSATSKYERQVQAYLNMLFYMDNEHLGNLSKSYQYISCRQKWSPNSNFTFS